MSKKSDDKLQRLVEVCMMFDSDNESHSTGSETVDNDEQNIQEILETGAPEMPMEIEQHSMVSLDKEINEIPLQSVATNYIVNSETGILEEIGCESTTTSLTLNTETNDQNMPQLQHSDSVSSIMTKKTRITLNERTGIFESKEYSEEESDKGEEVRKGKKKKAKPTMWQKNLTKMKRLKNHPMRAIPKCRCDCKNKLTKKDRTFLYNKFIGLSTHTEQNIFLQGCVKEGIPQRFRPRKTQGRNRRVFNYVVDVSGKCVTVCANAFYAIFGIKRDRLKKKVLQKYKDITDGRGKHDNHPRKIPEEAITRVHSFISGLPAVVSHYSRTENRHRKYLSADLSIAELHRKFIGSNPDLKNVISYEKMREIFNYDFNLSFGVPRKDICNICEKLKVEIESAKCNHQQDIVTRLNTEKELHQRKAEVFFNKLKDADFIYVLTFKKTCHFLSQIFKMNTTGDSYGYIILAYIILMMVVLLCISSQKIMPIRGQTKS